jgi:hypothetical protein
MDTKYKAAIEADHKLYGVNSNAGSFRVGFELAIELLKNNKFHGHYATQCAEWLKKHLEQEVSSKTTATKRGY